jgi:NAD+ diphosphatase
VSPRTLPHLALSAHAHNRLGLQRTDEAWLERTWKEPSTRVLLVSGSRLRPVGGEVEWVSPDRAPEGRRVLLGEEHGAAHFAVLLDPVDAPGAEEEWVPLRTVLGTVAESDPDQAPLLFHAIGMAEWHFATTHCPRCGGGLESVAAGHELRCASCGRRQFPRTDPAVIMAITHGEPGSPDEALLLGRQRVWPEGRWSTLAGFCEPGETLEDAVRREVYEEVGIRVGPVAYFGSQPWPLPASLMVGFTGRAEDTEIHVDGAEIEEARWFTRRQFAADAAAGRLKVPGGISISSSLIEDWYGEPLPAPW